MEENLQTSQVESTDNSDLDTAIENAFNDEPSETTEKPATEDKVEDVGTKEEPDNTPTLDVPDKFKGKDGNVDVSNLLKSYKELESYSSSEKAKWQEERAELLKAKEELDKQKEAQEQQAKQNGFNSVLDMQEQFALVNTEVNEYAKYLHITENPEQVRQMLVDYLNNPNEALLADIELEFSPDVIKKAAIAKEQQRAMFAQQHQTQLETQRMSNIENVISTSVANNEAIFAYKPFETLFTNTLKRFGDSFTQEDADVLISAIGELKEEFRKEFEKEHGIKQENDKATDKLAGISNTKSAPVTSTPDINKMSTKELEKYLETFI